MTTFANILTETDQMLKMTSEFASQYLDVAEAKVNAPAIAIPATDSQQGEQKVPVAKPNGITR